MNKEKTKKKKRSEENLRLVLSGHVDHGKSTLIGRLFYDTDSLPEGKYDEIKSICDSLGKPMEFGYVMDHLQEERDQGITIDTAQTFFKTDRRHYTIIDAPGHVEFIKNMITGASQAEAAILIVDAEEGLQEQTRRHAYILSMLGLKQVVAVINKMDLVDYDQKRYQQVSKDLEKFLKKIKITPKEIVPISAMKGDNIAKKSEKIDWYQGPTILEALDKFEIEKPLTEKPLRLPVQDVYKWDKRIIAGRISSGVIKKGDKITILPSGEETEVKSVLKYKEDIDQAIAGDSVGIETKDKVFVDRGNVISEVKDKPTTTKTLKANLFWMDKDPLKKGERVLFKLATQSVMAEITKFERVIDSSTLEVVGEGLDKLENRQTAQVEIETADEVVVDSFNEVPELGRFVLERTDTVAGGIIIEE
jgi:sulfate adenylyltransferase large subunit